MIKKGFPRSFRYPSADLRDQVRAAVKERGFRSEQAFLIAERKDTNVSSVVSQRAHDKNLEFLMAVQQDLPANLVGDPLRLDQILNQPCEQRGEIHRTWRDCGDGIPGGKGFR